MPLPPQAPRPVYRQSSYAPTRGQNDPRGYLMREIALRAQRSAGKTGPFGGVSKFGSTGRSETRSGIADGILKRQAGAKPAVPAKPTSQGAAMPADGDTRSMAQNYLMKLLGVNR